MMDHVAMFTDHLQALADAVLNETDDIDNSEEEEANSNVNDGIIDRSQFNCENFINSKTNGGTDVSDKLCYLYVMSLGQKNNKIEGLSLDCVPFSKLPKPYRIKLSVKHYNDEIIRHGNAYILIEKKRPNQWNNEKHIQWLQQNPIPARDNPEDIRFIEDEWFRMTDFCNRLIGRSISQKPRSADASIVKKKWDGNVPWLCLFMCLLLIR